MNPRVMVIATLLGIGLFLSFMGCHNPPVQPPVAPSNTSQQPSTQNAASTAAPLFRDVARSAGLDFHWGPRDPTQLTILDMMGFGCAFLDRDGQGTLDIVLVAKDHLVYYRNRGDGTFEDVTAQAFPNAPRTPYLMGVSVCDYDGDGQPDLFVSGYGRAILYHNEGNGSFREVTKGSGLEARGPDDWTTSVAWADVDGDGRPDLYVCRYVKFNASTKQLCAFEGKDGETVMTSCSPTAYVSQQGSLYHNDGNGKFHDITRQAGLSDAHGNGLGCMFCDFDNEGKPGLFIANDQRPADLYRNLGQSRFKNVAPESGVAYASDGRNFAGMGIDWGDYDNDGHIDLLVSNYASQPKCLFHQEANNLFINDARVGDLSAHSLDVLTFGANFVDVDNDGRLDIVLVNGHVQSLVDRIDATATYPQSSLLFHNIESGVFKDISVQAGSDFTRKIVGRGVAVGDYDRDGRLDLLIVDAEGAPLLLHNEGPHNHFLSLRCLDRTGKVDALGARVTLKTGNLTQIREVRSAGTYLSADAPAVHFGCGDQTQVDSLMIRWPDGKTSAFSAVATDHFYTVHESDSQLLPLR